MANDYSFKNDYSEGAHPDILDAFQQGNLVQEKGYGEDRFCQDAADCIRQHIKNPDADVHFVSGGTQANLIAIASILRPHEAVIAAETGHIAVHEAGAIEATGHKIITIPVTNGKLSTEDIRRVLELHTDEHMVKPKLVFISNTTEIGTLYCHAELEKLSKFCQKQGLYLYLDGARLASALTSQYNDLSLPQLSSYSDLFYIGGTKNGILYGEALIINRKELKPHFRFHLKQRGALLAKSRFLGIQFRELFKDNLYFQLGRHANQMAAKLAEGLKESGYSFLTKPVSNQIFPILPNEKIQSLSKKYGFYVWQKLDQDHSAIRLVTSWATQEKQINRFIMDLK